MEREIKIRGVRCDHPWQHFNQSFKMKIKSHLDLIIRQLKSLLTVQNTNVDRKYVP